jgi:hypothetical protein
MQKRRNTMEKKTFNTILASVMAGAMTVGVASFANKAADKTAKKETTTKAAKTTKATKEHKDAKAADTQCANKEGHDAAKDGEHHE